MKTPLSNQQDENPLAGKNIFFSAYRADNALLRVFPLQGKVVRPVSFADQVNWLLVELYHGFKFEQLHIKHVLIKRADKEPVQLKKVNQLVHFKLVPDVTLLNPLQSADDYPLMFWALCQ